MATWCEIRAPAKYQHEHIATCYHNFFHPFQLDLTVSLFPLPIAIRVWKINISHLRFHKRQNSWVQYALGCAHKCRVCCQTRSMAAVWPGRLRFPEPTR